MGTRRRTSTAGRIADGALALLIVAAPLAAGSWRLETLPVLALMATVAFGAAALNLSARGRSLHVGALPLVLVALAAVTALQAVPWPAGALEALSGRAQALRAFVQGDAGGGPVSYEPGATWREVAKLLLYALVAQVARERARTQSLRETVAFPVVAAGILSAGVALLHRFLGIERLFGVFEPGSGERMLTTFVNPNHAGGFMALTCLMAVGLAAGGRSRPERLGFGAAAIALGALCLTSRSKGAIGALAFGLLLFAALRAWRRRHAADPTARSGPVAVGAALFGGAVALTLSAPDLAARLGADETTRELGLLEKAAALQDALPMIRDHLLTGVGRGAYVSVYTQYKTSVLQLTFAFPENAVVQLLSEWGIAVGGLAGLGLVSAVVTRLWRSGRSVPLAATCGVAAVVLQNLVDFSLELPGMAAPVAAILGGASGRWARGPKLSSRRPAFWAVAAAGPILLGAAVTAAFLAGDLQADLQRVQAAAEARRAPDATGAAETATPDVDALARRHPASALLAAQAAYLAELQAPPDLGEALRWANRALYLAPNYASGHLVAGRLLIRAGYRAQGFDQLRTAWTLAGADRVAPWVEHVIDLARTPEEVARAVPRRDPALDVLDEAHLARVVRRLAARGRTAWGRALLTAHLDPAEAPRDTLQALALAADASQAPDLAATLSARLLEEAPEDAAARLLAARIRFRAGDLDAARALLSDAQALSADRAELLELRLRVELTARDLDAAAATLKALRARAPPGRGTETRLTLLEVELARRAGRPRDGLKALDRALDKRVGAVDLLRARAALLIELGHESAARDDLRYILRRRPGDPEATRRLADLEAVTEPPPPP